MVTRFDGVIVVLVAALMTSCDDKSSGVRLSVECGVDAGNMMLMYRLVNDGKGDVYLIDSESVGVRQADGKIDIIVGRREKSENIHYNVFVPPVNVHIPAGRVVSGEIRVDAKDYRIDTGVLEHVELSVMISREDLFRERDIVKPSAYFDAVEQQARIYTALCVF